MAGYLAAVAAAFFLAAAPQSISRETMEDMVYEVRAKTLNPYDTWGIYENMQIIYKAGDERVILTAEDVIDWVRYWPDGHWDIDDNKIAEFVSTLQKKFDTWDYYKTLRTTTGKVIKVRPGEYGWKLDREKEIKEISKLLRRNGISVHNLHFSREAAVFGDPRQDYGDSYAEVNLTAQKMWLYIEGEMVLESDIVSGMMNTSRQTPEGAYAIYYKQSPAVLKGADYQTPVTFWMPFNRGIGFHDATWQSSFGGDACYYRGSHGCINLPYDAAEKLYGYMKKGFPVLCYYEE